MINPVTQGEDSEVCVEKRRMALPWVRDGRVHSAGKSWVSRVTGILLHIHCDKSIPKMTSQPYFSKKYWEQVEGGGMSGGRRETCGEQT